MEYEGLAAKELENAVYKPADEDIIWFIVSDQEGF